MAARAIGREQLAAALRVARLTSSGTTLMLRKYATMAQSSLSGAALGGMLLPGTPLRMT